MIGAATCVCAVIGDPVAHSLSPAIHNAAFAASGLDWVYVAFQVAPGRLGDAVMGMRAFGIRGLSVTIPHKVSIIPHLDEVDELARWVGSVNTVVNRDGRLVGHTTDGHGALEALRAEGETVAGKRVLLLGSGGAARAIAFALARDATPGAMEILGIEDAQRDQLVEELGSKTGVPVTGGRLDRLRPAIEEAQLLIHATPVGMHPREGESLVPPSLLRPDLPVFDIVYRPLTTRLLRDAEARGSRVVLGVGMFIHQAAVQFRLWTGREPPIPAMEEVVRARLGRG
ncbi:MAG: shikimate dehydrogenase [Candidatus Riflebacteria bacterium]|nr:shikimate dehydrogenase [Candidatus Riflebacteria bacterium]